jgi:hypothetical protein
VTEMQFQIMIKKHPRASRQWLPRLDFAKGLFNDDSTLSVGYSDLFYNRFYSSI